MRISTRRWSAAILATAIAVGSAGLGVAADSPNNPKADIQRDNSACGTDLALPVIGFANYHRTGDTVNVQFHIKGGEPNHTYFIQLWQWNTAPNNCFFVGPTIPEQAYPFGEEVTTNKKGVANASITVEVQTTWTRFLAAAWDPAVNHWHDALFVILEP